MIASLPMYLHDGNVAAHDTFWTLIREDLAEQGIAAPERLSHDAPIRDTWGRPDLVLGHICSLPVRTDYLDRVTVIAAGDHGLPDTPPGHYFSHFVTRADDPRDTLPAFAEARLAINSDDSQSGWGSAYDAAARAGFRFAHVTATGAHRASIHAVATGAADIAAIDAVTWRLLHHLPEIAHLKIIGETARFPAIAYVTAGQVDPVPHRHALIRAVDALAPDARTALGLRGIVAAQARSYAALPIAPLPPAA